VGEEHGRPFVPAALGLLPARHGLAQVQLAARRGISERAIFVVDKQGKIAYINIHDITKQPPTDKIFEALKKLK
jgi:peroxiredoxin